VSHPRVGDFLVGWHAALAAAARLPDDARAPFLDVVAHARQAVAAGEDDDWVYARMQAPVRRAILALGARLARAGALDVADDAFHLELPTLRAVDHSEARGEALTDLRAEAARGRTLTEAARRQPPPLSSDQAFSATGVLRGSGCGGRVVGRVVLRHGPTGTHPPPDAVLVATTLLPTELPLLQVAAVVTETGGPLGHVATQARERGLTAVVGAAGATTLLREGDTVLVDGAAGLVLRTPRG
jgi:pyruvate,water dikinase